MLTSDEIIHSPITDRFRQQGIGNNDMVDSTVRFITLTDVQT